MKFVKVNPSLLDHWNMLLDAYPVAFPGVVILLAILGAAAFASWFRL